MPYPITTLLIWEAWIAYLKSQTLLVAELDSSLQIKQLQWQGDEFLYPAVRLSVIHFPSVNGCGPDDIEIFIEVFSEEKSAKQVMRITSILQLILNKKAFIQNGIKFPMVWVDKINKPTRDIYAWKQEIHIKGLAV